MKIDSINFSFFQWKSFFINKQVNNHLDKKPNYKFFVDIISKSFAAIENLIQSNNFYNYLKQSKQVKVNSRIFDKKKDSKQILEIQKIAKIILKTKDDRNKLENLFDSNRIIFFKLDFHSKHHLLICFAVNIQDKWKLFPLFWDFNHCIDLVSDKFDSSEKYKWLLSEISI